MREKIEHSKWADVLSIIRKKVSEVSYKTWIVPINPLYKDDGEKIVALSCADQFKANLIKNRYLNDITSAVKEVFGKDFGVSFSYNSEEEDSDDSEEKSTSSSSNISTFSEEYVSSDNIASNGLSGDSPESLSND